MGTEFSELVQEVKENKTCQRKNAKERKLTSLLKLNLIWLWRKARPWFNRKGLRLAERKGSPVKYSRRCCSQICNLNRGVYKVCYLRFPSLGVHLHTPWTFNQGLTFALSSPPHLDAEAS